MWTNKILRVLGAFFALTLLATACGSDTTDTQTTDDDTVADEDATTDDDTVADVDAMTDDDMADMDHDDDDMADMDHDDDHSDDMADMDHGAATIDVDPSLPIPEVAMILTETDDPGIFDLKVILANFTITPENVDGDPIDNEGHMHLLIDGEKVEKFYELERQVMVPEGEHLVEVELNANNHSAYAVDGTPIRTGMTVTGAGEAMADGDDDHDHDHGDSAAAVEDGLTAADADVTIMATYEAGEVSLDDADRVEVAVDDVVMIMITSDIAEEAHVHGYDILAEVGPDTEGMILFTADTPGRFEIEFETSGTFIAELVVS